MLVRRFRALGPPGHQPFPLALPGLLIVRLLPPALPTHQCARYNPPLLRMDQHIVNHIDIAAQDEDADAEEAVSPSTEEGPILRLSLFKSLTRLCLILVLFLQLYVTGVDGKVSEKTTGKVSTHGPRGSRRERWRASKGMTPRPRLRGMSRQGTAASRYKPGRSHRRR